MCLVSERNKGNLLRPGAGSSRDFENVPSQQRPRPTEIREEPRFEATSPFPRFTLPNLWKSIAQKRMICWLVQQNVLTRGKPRTMLMQSALYTRHGSNFSFLSECERLSFPRIRTDLRAVFVVSVRGLRREFQTCLYLGALCCWSFRPSVARE